MCKINVTQQQQRNQEADSTHRLDRLDRMRAMAQVEQYVQKRVASCDLGMLMNDTDNQSNNTGGATDQWDFEIRLNHQQEVNQHQPQSQLEECVRVVWNIITDAEDFILTNYPQILLPGHISSFFRLAQDVTFITKQELCSAHHDLELEDSENAAVNKHGAIFILDDKSDSETLGGEMLVRHPLTGQSHKVGSMEINIPVDHEVVAQQEEESSCSCSFKGTLGFSSLYMLLLRTTHMDQVQAVGIVDGLGSSDVDCRQAQEASASAGMEATARLFSTLQA